MSNICSFPLKTLLCCVCVFVFVFYRWSVLHRFIFIIVNEIVYLLLISSVMNSIPFFPPCKTNTSLCPVKVSHIWSVVCVLSIKAYLFINILVFFYFPPLPNFFRYSTLNLNKHPNTHPPTHTHTHPHPHTHRLGVPRGAAHRPRAARRGVRRQDRLRRVHRRLCHRTQLLHAGGEVLRGTRVEGAVARG